MESFCEHVPTLIVFVCLLAYWGFMAHRRPRSLCAQLLIVNLISKNKYGVLVLEKTEIFPVQSYASEYGSSTHAFITIFCITL